MQRLHELRQYLIDLNTIPRLSREEVHELTSRLAAAQQGRLSPEQEAQAKQRLIEGHLWLPVTLIRRSGARLRSLSPLDLVQQGNLGLLRALDRFDCASGGSLTAYAATTIYYAVLDALPMENTIRVSYGLTWRHCTNKRIEQLRALQPLSLNTLHGEAEDCTFAETLEAPPLVLPDPVAAEERRQRAKHAEVEALLSRLTEREQQMLLLEAACADLERQGLAITVKALARQSHVDKAVTRPFVLDYWNQHGSVQERLEAEGLSVTMTRLCSRAAAAFLKNYHPVARPKPRPASKDKLARSAKATPQERLQAAYSRLAARGEKITRARLRQEARVSTDAAGAFLRSQRTGDATTAPQD